MKRSVNINGFSQAARGRASRKAFSVRAYMETCKALGLSDEEIKQGLREMLAVRKTEPATITNTESDERADVSTL